MRLVGLVLVIVSICGAAVHSSLAITINHTNWNWYVAQDSAVWNKVAQQKIFFTHASVGGNIVNGLHTLARSNASRYPLNIYNWPGEDPSYHGGVATAGTSGSPDYRASSDPETTTQGYLYDCYRQNPPWENKLVCFSNSLTISGWGNKCDYVMDKLCWIDPDADANTYLASMVALEAVFTNALFVYTTMPLTGNSDSDNDLRNVFNNTVRTYLLS